MVFYCFDRLVCLDRNVDTDPAQVQSVAVSLGGGGEGERTTSSCQDPWDENNFEM